MKKSEADKRLDKLYEATYDDAIAYIGGTIGSLDNAEEILCSVYFDMYRYFLKCHEYNAEDMKTQYLKALKKSIAPYITEQEHSLAPAKMKRTIKSVEKMLNTELDIADPELFESRLNKKIYSFIMSKPLPVKKTFILYFYCGYEPKHISELLEIEESDVTHTLYTLLKEIRDAFLKNRIVKTEEKA